MLLIDNWLNGKRNFYTGRNILLKYSTNKAIKTLLEKGETPLSVAIMNKELIAVNDRNVRPSTPIDKEKVLLSIMPKGNDCVMKGLEEEYKPLYAQMNMLRYDLDKYGGDNSLEVRMQCHLNCKQILALEQECMQIWEKRDYYEKHGRLPDVAVKKTKLTTDPLELSILVQSALRQIRRYKPTKETNSKHAQLYKDYCSKYKEITGNEYQEKN